MIYKDKKELDKLGLELSTKSTKLILDEKTNLIKKVDIIDDVQEIQDNKSMTLKELLQRNLPPFQDRKLNYLDISDISYDINTNHNYFKNNNKLDNLQNEIKEKEQEIQEQQPIELEKQEGEKNEQSA